MTSEQSRVNRKPRCSTTSWLADVDPIAVGNIGYMTRHEFFQESHRVDMQGPFHINVFQGQSSMLPYKMTF